MNHRFACLASIALLRCIIDTTAWDEARPAQAQESIQERTFKVSTELVEVRAVVTGRDGRIVEDLVQEDFELLENGRPQEISFFSVSQVGERQDKPAASNIPPQYKGSRPDYNVRTPKGYLPSDLSKVKGDETAKTPQQRLLQAMKAPLPVTDLGVSARADFLETETDDKQVTLTVYFDGDRFKYREQGQRNLVELEIVYVVYDSSGRQVDATSAHVEGRLTPERLTQARISGYRFSRRLMLKSGVYQVRIGVREEGTNCMGFF